jgi:hypothetical protein
MLKIREISSLRSKSKFKNQKSKLQRKIKKQSQFQNLFSPLKTLA